jgi:hypothetical protein
MAEVRFGQPGLYAVAVLGDETKQSRLEVYHDAERALHWAIEACGRHREFVVYQLREVARVTMPAPAVDYIGGDLNG